MTAPLIHPEVAAMMDGFWRQVFSHKSETALWLESPEVTAWCRDREVERLEESGVILGGLS